MYKYTYECINKHIFAIYKIYKDIDNCLYQKRIFWKNFFFEQRETRNRENKNIEKKNIYLMDFGIIRS